MSLLLRTIKSYPKGKLAEELIYLLDKDCDPHRRISVFSELTELEKQNLIIRGKDGKWRGRFHITNARPLEGSDHSEGELEAIPGYFETLTETELQIRTSEIDDQIERFYARFLPLSKEMAKNLQSFGE